jgi:hypothetical protein
MRTHPIATLLASILISLNAIGAEDPPMTSVHIINAASVELVSIKINGKNSYPDLRQGNQISGGPNEDLTMNLEAISNLDGTSVKYGEPFLNQGSYVITLIGDFAKIERTPENEKLPGFSQLDSKFLTRAAMMRFDVKGQEGGRTVTIINGVPNGLITFNVGTEAPEKIGYGAISKTYVVSSETTDISVSAPNYSKKLKFNFLEHEDGILLVFFADATTGNIKYVVGRLRTLSSHQKFIESTTSAP